MHRRITYGAYVYPDDTPSPRNSQDFLSCHGNCVASVAKLLAQCDEGTGAVELDTLQLDDGRSSHIDVGKAAGTTM
jgi:hypothetical protein